MKNINIKEKLNKFYDILCPPGIKCVFCGDDIKHPNKYHYCNSCKESLPYNNKKVCRLCGCKIEDSSNLCLNCFKELPNFDMARSPFLYERPISSIVNKFKFENAKYLFKPLSEFLIDEYKKSGFNAEIIIPMPLSKQHLKERKYNQAEELAKPVAEALNIEISTEIIERVKDTKKQSRLNYEERKKNLEGAFKIKNKTKIKNKVVLVIDDVFTTGSTLNAFCKELRKAKPAKILVLTLAHTNLNRKQPQNMLTLLKTSLKTKLKIAKNHNKILRRMRKVIKLYSSGKVNIIVH